MFGQAQSKGGLCAKGLTPRLDREVDLRSCFLGNRTAKAYVEGWVQKPLTWNSAPVLEIEAAAFCVQVTEILKAKMVCFTLT